MWYFPSNLPHGIIGLEPEGCQFVSGFKSADFDELNALSASTWFATVPVETLAQVRQMSTSACRYLPYCCAEKLLSSTKLMPWQVAYRWRVLGKPQTVHMHVYCTPCEWAGWLQCWSIGIQYTLQCTVGDVPEVHVK